MTTTTKKIQNLGTDFFVVVERTELTPCPPTGKAQGQSITRQKKLQSGVSGVRRRKFLKPRDEYTAIGVQCEIREGDLKAATLTTATAVVVAYQLLGSLPLSSS